MNNKEIQDLAKEYLSDNENIHDYHAFAYDHDERLLNKVVFSWAQGHNVVNSNLLSLYIVEIASQNHSV